MRILAVIPARGDSKGIPRKNIRLLAGKPLIYHCIRTAQHCTAITDIAVTTDNAEIADIAEQYGAEVVLRPASLATDEVTLDPVVHHAVGIMEKRHGAAYDVVVTLQPTSPLLRAETLGKGLEYFRAGAWDTVLSVVNRPRLLWEKQDDAMVPLYTERYRSLRWMRMRVLSCVRRMTGFSQNIDWGENASLFGRTAIRSSVWGTSIIA